MMFEFVTFYEGSDNALDMLKKCALSTRTCSQCRHCCVHSVSGSCECWWWRWHWGRYVLFNCQASCVV